MPKDLGRFRSLPVDDRAGIGWRDGPLIFHFCKRRGGIELAVLHTDNRRTVHRRRRQALQAHADRRRSAGQPGGRYLRNRYFIRRSVAEADHDLRAVEGADRPPIVDLPNELRIGGRGRGLEGVQLARTNIGRPRDRIGRRRQRTHIDDDPRFFLAVLTRIDRCADQYVLAGNEGPVDRHRQTGRSTPLWRTVDGLHFPVPAVGRPRGHVVALIGGGLVLADLDRAAQVIFV